MGMELKPFFVFFLLVLAALFPLLHANGHIGEWDDVLRRRAEEAVNRTHAAYDPNHDAIVAHVNRNVSKMWRGQVGNTTRRSLRRSLGGPCLPTNPIDACWRCDSNWAINRFRLADCKIGFGHRAVGGKGGRIYVVEDSSDGDVVNPKPGTLRHGATLDGPVWIIFARDMVITLSQELLVAGDKTIDGRGANVHIAHGAGITIQFVKNVIIHGLRIHDIKVTGGGMIRDSFDHIGLRTEADGDGVSLYGAQDVWLDHLSLTRCADGLIDIVQGSTAITISNCHFTDHDHVMLLGAHDDFLLDEKMQITIVFNHFGKGLVQRMPRARLGFIHTVNNDYIKWKMYAVGGSAHPTIISQGNRFIADQPHAKQVTKREKASESEWKRWTWVSQHDLFLRGAYFVASGDQFWYYKHRECFDHVLPGSALLVEEMTEFAGSLACKAGAPC